MTPSKLENIEKEPTQLYISLDAPNEVVYNEVCQPQISRGWEHLQTSLELLSNFDCRTVIRTTCVKDYNMLNPQEYANMIEKANPDFVEIKAYMYVGSSRERLELSNMPSLDDVNKFAASIAELCGREIVNDAFESRVVLLA